jgi:phage-related protein
MRKINYYTKINGSKPVEKFILSLDDKFAMKITWVLNIVKETEHISNIHSEYLKKLTADIWEIRAKVGRNAFRLLCFFDGQNLIIATNGFKKKTQKTPKREIAIAEQRRKDYYERKNRNG